MEITIKDSTIVRPAHETPKGSLWISNLDLVMVRYHVPTVYYYKPNGSNFFDPTRLKEALSNILVLFYPLAGKLGYEEDGRLEIICNAEGALFIEAEGTFVMDNLVGNYGDDSGVSRLVPEVDYSGRISSFPLLLVQVTTFKCGGVSLGLKIHHAIADGTSALHFINSWAEIARGASPSIPPFFDRTLLRARDPPTPTFHHAEYDPPPTMKHTKTNNSLYSTPYELNNPSIVSIFKLTVDQLNTLKSKANTTTTTTKYSTYTILTAHLWRSISKARGLSDDQPTKIYVPINGRSRLNPPLPPGYFGNVMTRTTQIVQAGDLQSEPFIDTVKRIHDLSKQGNDEYFRSAIDYIEKAHDKSTLVMKRDNFRCPNLLALSWMWLPLYEADFGWGRPIYVGMAEIASEGRVIIMSSPNNDGSLSLLARLETSHMELFKKYLYEF